MAGTNYFQSHTQTRSLSYQMLHDTHMVDTRDGTQTHNLLLRREAPYPLGHTSLLIGAFKNCIRHCAKSLTE